MLGVGQWACDFDRFAGLEMSYLILFEYCMHADSNSGSGETRFDRVECEKE